MKIIENGKNVSVVQTYLLILQSHADGSIKFWDASSGKYHRA